MHAWPPAENRPRVASEVSSLSATKATGSPPPLKRFKHELSWCDRGLYSESSCCSESFGEEFSAVEMLSPEELHIVHCDYSVLADALLAQWWEDRDVKEISRSRVWNWVTSKRGESCARYLSRMQNHRHSSIIFQGILLIKLNNTSRGSLCCTQLFGYIFHLITCVHVPKCR